MSLQQLRNSFEHAVAATATVTSNELPRFSELQNDLTKVAVGYIAMAEVGLEPKVVLVPGQGNPDRWRQYFDASDQRYLGAASIEDPVVAMQDMASWYLALIATADGSAGRVDSLRDKLLQTCGQALDSSWYGASHAELAMAVATKTVRPVDAEVTCHLRGRAESGLPLATIFPACPPHVYRRGTWFARSLPPVPQSYHLSTMAYNRHDKALMLPVFNTYHAVAKT